MATLASLREKLQKLKMQREQERKEHGQDLTGNTTDHRTWVKRIEQDGDKAEDWLAYTNFLVKSVQFQSESIRQDRICNIYSKAIKFISEKGTHKNEAFAHLFVNYAKFVSQMDEDDARNLYDTARTTLKKYAIVHISSAEFEFRQGNKERCRKIFSKAQEIEVQPQGLLEVAYRNFLLGQQQFLTEEDLTQFSSPSMTGDPAVLSLPTDGHSLTADLTKDSGISLTADSSDRQDSSYMEEKDSLSRASRRGGHTDGACSSSDDSLPLSHNTLDHAFSQPTSSRIPANSLKASNLLKPISTRRQLHSLASGDTEGHTSDGGNISKMGASMLNKAFLPVDSDNSEEDGTVSFKIKDKGRKRSMCSGALSDDCDTVPLSIDGSDSNHNRPLRSSHSTPDCKNPSMLSSFSSSSSKSWFIKDGAQRFKGKARRVLTQVKEDTNQDSQSIEHPLPAMPDLDLPSTQECSTEETSIGDACSRSSTLKMSDASQCTLMNTPSIEQRSSPEAMQTDHTKEPCNLPPQTVPLSSAHSVEGRPVPVLPLGNDSQSAASQSAAGHSQGQVSVDHRPKKIGSNAESSSLVVPALGCAGTSGQVPSLITTAATPLRPVTCLGASQSALPAPQPVVMTASTPAPAAPVPATPQHQAINQSMMSNMCTPSAKQQMLVINGTPYSVLRCIGQGGTSTVYQVLNSENKIRAVKVVNLAGADDSTIDSYKNEIALLQRLQKSDRVITMYDYEFNLQINLLTVVMECGDPDLATFFSRNKKLNDIKIMYYWQEMLEAVQALHSEGIVHTDLKPANFLLVAGHLKLIDFGIAKAIQQDMTSVTTDQQVGTLNFMSPEALMFDCSPCDGDDMSSGNTRRKSKIGYKSDVWSLGCILYRMVYGRTPFQAIRSQIQKIQAIVNPNHAIQFPDIPNKHLLDTLKRCLVRDPQARPSIQTLLQHPYLTSKNKEASPVASTPSNAALARLIQQVFTLSPGSLSAVRQAASTASDLKSDKKSTADAASRQRAPLAPLNQIDDPNA